MKHSSTDLRSPSPPIETFTHRIPTLAPIQNRLSCGRDPHNNYTGFPLPNAEFLRGRHCKSVLFNVNHAVSTGSERSLCTHNRRSNFETFVRKNAGRMEDGNLSRFILDLEQSPKSQDSFRLRFAPLCRKSPQPILILARASVWMTALQPLPLEEAIATSATDLLDLQEPVDCAASPDWRPLCRASTARNEIQVPRHL